MISNNKLIPYQGSDIASKAMTMGQSDSGIIDTTKRMSLLLRDSKAQKTTPGLMVDGFKITQSDWDHASDFETLMKDYTQMRNGDSFVSSSVDVLMNPILNANLNIKAEGIDENTPPSPLAEEAQQYIQDTFNKLYRGQLYYHRHLTLAFYYGCAFFEPVWLKGSTYNGKVTNILAKISPIQTDTIQRWYYDDLEEFIGLRLWKRKPNQGVTPIDMYSEDLHYFTPFEEFNNVSGRSILRASRFAWNIKQQILKSSARAASRGAGIPVGTIAKGITDDNTVLATKIQTIMQTIGNSENTGVVDQEGVWSFRLESLQNQSDNMNLLNFCNSDIVYNTLTQFLVSGIGGSGSRAATQSHKGPYVEALACYVKLIEDNYNQLIGKILDNSYFYGKLDPLEYPTATLDISKDVDLTQTADNFLKLVQATGIKPTPEDEKYLREVFNLPTIDLETIKANQEQAAKDKAATLQPPIIQPLNQKPENIPQQKKQDNQPDLPFPTDQQTKLSKMSKSAKYVGTKHPGVEYLDKQQKAIQDIIDSHYKMMVEIAKVQLQKDPFKPIIIPQNAKDELFKTINLQYNKIWDAGYKDSTKQLNQIDNSFKLARGNGPLGVSKNGKKLEYVVDLLGDAVENQVNTNMLNVNQSMIDNAGGINSFVDDRFGDSQNQIKASILSNTLSGYNDGINNAQDDYEQESGNELMKAYTVQLETKNICEKCFPYEGIVFSKTDAEDLGLNWSDTPINPECLGLLGNNQCQCTWQAESLA